MVGKEAIFTSGGGGGGAVKLHFRALPMRSNHNPAMQGNQTIACGRCSTKCCIVGLVNAVKGNKNRARALSILERE